MSNIKDLIKEKLNQLSKEDLVDALADICTIYVSANITIGYVLDTILDHF